MCAWWDIVFRGLQRESLQSQLLLGLESLHYVDQLSIVNRQLSRLKDAVFCIYADDLFYSSKFIWRRIVQSSLPNVAIVNTFCNCFNRQYLWSHLPSEIRFTKQDETKPNKKRRGRSPFKRSHTRSRDSSKCEIGSNGRSSSTSSSRIDTRSRYSSRVLRRNICEEKWVLGWDVNCQLVNVAIVNCW